MPQPMQMHVKVKGVSGSIKSLRQIFGRRCSILPLNMPLCMLSVMRREIPNTWRDLRAAGGVLQSPEAAFEPTLPAPARQKTCGFGALCADADHLRNRRGFYSFAYC